jgi:pimeloyl-ACP methyl ester carboxylesterase
MFLDIQGARTYAYTGGKAFNPQQPTVLFLHGVLNDHSVWILQSRYLAHHGWNVLALDLPGHCRSQGEAPASVEAAADFVVGVVDALQAMGVQQVALVGHSWGSLYGLEAASRLQHRVSHLVLIGTAYPMKVSPALLDASLNQPEQAIQMINVYSRSTLCSPNSALGPGTWVFGSSVALGRKVLRSNPRANVFHRGFSACNDYSHGLEAMAQVTAPVLFILGERDQMTPPKAAAALLSAAQKRPLPASSTQVIRLTVGHHQMTEAPEGTLSALRTFLSAAKPVPG